VVPDTLLEPKFVSFPASLPSVIALAVAVPARPPAELTSPVVPSSIAPAAVYVKVVAEIVSNVAALSSDTLTVVPDRLIEPKLVSFPASFPSVIVLAVAVSDAEPVTLTSPLAPSSIAPAAVYINVDAEIVSNVAALSSDTLTVVPDRLI